MKHVLVILIFLLLVLGVTAYIMQQLKKEYFGKLPVNSYTKTDGLCRRSNESYGGYCTKSGVSENDCNEKCSDPDSDCIASGH